MLTGLILFCQVSALIFMSGGLVVRNTIMGIFQKIDLHQIPGFFQEIKAIRTQMAHVKLFSLPCGSDHPDHRLLKVRSGQSRENEKSR
jgi:hypothetical protein